MRTSLKWQLVSQIVLTFFAVQICISAYSVFQTKNEFVSMSVESSSNQIRQLAQETENVLTGYVSSVESYAKMIRTVYADGVPASPAVFKQIDRITALITDRHNSNVYGYWFLTDYDYRTPVPFLSWYGIKNGQMMNMSNQFAASAASPVNSDDPYYDFYFGAKRTGSTYFSHVYTNIYLHEEMITISTPVFDEKHTLIGVAGIDLNLKELQDMLDVMKIGTSGYAILLSDSGNLMFHPNRKFIHYEASSSENDSDLYAITGQIAGKSPSIHIKKYQGTDMYFFSQPIPVSGWNIVAIVPEAEINERFDNALTNEIRTIFVELAACAVIVIFWTSKTVVNPLRQLLNANKQHEDGYFIEPIAPASNNEIGKLAEMVNNLFQKQKRYKEMEEEMKRVNSLHVVGEMAASVSHEIRNPMTTIRGFLQILRNKKEYQADLVYFDTMIEEVTRANSIITEYLTLAQNRSTELRSQDLNVIIQSIYPLVQASAASNSHTITLELGNIPNIQLDDKEIRQLLHNLIRNALEAMQESGVVTIRTIFVDDVVKLSVQDQGSGIEPHILKQLGTPFITSKETGTGLGMTISYNIVRRHNATLKVETGPEGTTFTVEFQA